MNANELLRYLSDPTKNNYGWDTKPIFFLIVLIKNPDHILGYTCR